jgi:DNA (cytosine-5)-methyltransferase 1
VGEEAYTAVKTNHRRPVAVDLFAGAGGFSLGIEQAGFDVLVAVEYDPIHACTHYFNFPLTEVLCANVSDITSDKIRQAAYRSWLTHQNSREDGKISHSKAHPPNLNCITEGQLMPVLLPPTPCPSWDGQIDLVFGGPPCQGFSIMGKREIDDDRNSLVFHFYRLVKELNPRYFVMENVPGMAAGEYKTLLSQLVSQFEAGGYQVQQGILNAADFGVPQKRRRLFVIGSKKGGVVNFPGSKKITVTVKDAITDLPDLDQFSELQTSDEVLLSDVYLRKLVEKSSAYTQMLRPFPFLSHLPIFNFSHPRLWNPLLLTSSMQTQHRESSKIRFAQTVPGELETISRFRRLDLNGLCYTLRAGTDSFRGGHTSPRPIHPTLPRVISVREAARLHSFPDWFRFHQTKWHGFRQVGNAVPPLLGQAIGEQIIATLGIVPSVPQQTLALGETQLLRFTPSEAKEFWEEKW